MCVIGGVVSPSGTRVNHGVTTLVMIEVQTGGYLGEDVIVRLEEAYGRSTL
jgi:mannose-6-phosphate isomerase-like protein (cupin superfamily)